MYYHGGMIDSTVVAGTSKESNLGLAIVVSVAAVIIACGYVFYREGTLDPFALYNKYVTLKTLRLDRQSVQVEIARTPAERKAGLNGRDSILRNQGMIFVFDRDGLYDIATADMRFAIDVAWLNASGDIVDIQTNIPPRLRDPVRARQSARYVLMLGAGTLARLGIDKESYVTLPPLQK